MFSPCKPSFALTQDLPDRPQSAHLDWHRLPGCSRSEQGNVANVEVKSRERSLRATPWSLDMPGDICWWFDDEVDEGPALKIINSNSTRIDVLWVMRWHWNDHAPICRPWPEDNYEGQIPEMYIEGDWNCKCHETCRGIRSKVCCISFRVITTGSWWLQIL